MGLIVAGIGVSSGDLSSNVYTAIIIMVAVTMVITPVWLKKAIVENLQLQMRHQKQQDNSSAFIEVRKAI